jgi:hypothetical protein
MYHHANSPTDSKQSALPRLARRVGVPKYRSADRILKCYLLTGETIVTKCGIICALLQPSGNKRRYDIGG